MVRFNFLAQQNSTEEDNEITNLLVERFNEIILSDKHTANERNIRHFIPFLNSLTPQQFIEKVHPQIDFMLKRTASIIPAVADTVKNLKFSIDHGMLKLLTSEILNDSSIISEELSKDCSNLFAEIARKIEEPSVASSLLVDYLMQKFIDSRLTTQSVPHR